MQAFKSNKLSNNLEKQKEMVERLTVVEAREYYEVDSVFHSICFEFAGKIRLCNIIEEFDVDYTRFRMLDMVAVRPFDRLYEEHKELFEAIKKRDKEKLDEVLKRHPHGNINRLGDKVHNELKQFFI